MHRNLPIAVWALAVAAIGTAGMRVDSTPVSTTAVPPLERIALVAVASGNDNAAPVGFVPSSPSPIRMRPVGGATFTAVPAREAAVAVPMPIARGIPELVLAAYRNAELALGSSMPQCGLPWNLLAGIGKIESDHAAGGNTDVAGTTLTAILGPALDGTLPGNEVIPEPAGTGYVRAVGPMQFLPSTWQAWGADGNADGVADPNNVFDAALAAGKYLCADGTDLRDAADAVSAVLRYNRSMSYAESVLGWAAAYRNGGVPVAVDVSTERVQPSSFEVVTTARDATESSDLEQSLTPATISEPTTIVPPAVPAELPTVGPVVEPTQRAHRAATEVVATTNVVPAAPFTSLPHSAAPEPATPVTVVPSVVVPTLAAPPVPTAVQPGLPQSVVPLTADPQPATPEPATPHTVHAPAVPVQTVPDPIQTQVVPTMPLDTTPN